VTSPCPLVCVSKHRRAPVWTGPHTGPRRASGR